MIVSAELETGMEGNVSTVQQIPIGTGDNVLDVMVTEFGIHRL